MRVKCSKLRRKNINDVLLWCKEAVTLLGRMQLQVSFMLQTFFWKFIKIPEALVTLESSKSTLAHRGSFFIYKWKVENVFVLDSKNNLVLS